uniref:Putative secreted protein n=1 Tax=Anopheles triannulatus TaxID=58253 RepID=A0A2M4B3E7_9DIPT
MPPLGRCFVVSFCSSSSRPAHTESEAANSATERSYRLFKPQRLLLRLCRNFPLVLSRVFEYSLPHLSVFKYNIATLQPARDQYVFEICKRIYHQIRIKDKSSGNFVW